MVYTEDDCIQASFEFTADKKSALKKHQLRIRGVFELHFGLENFILDFCFFQPLLNLLMKDVTLSEGKYLIAEYV